MGEGGSARGASFPEREARCGGRWARPGWRNGLAEPAAEHDPAIHCPVPADHHMTGSTDPGGGDEPVAFIKDYVGLDYHNDGHTHIDALCHVAYEGRLYNDR